VKYGGGIVVSFSHAWIWEAAAASLKGVEKSTKLMGKSLLLEVRCAVSKIIPSDNSAEIENESGRECGSARGCGHLHDRAASTGCSSHDGASSPSCTPLDGAASTSGSAHDLAAGAGRAPGGGGVFAVVGRHFEVFGREYKLR
jgi:hypothetical protein